MPDLTREISLLVQIAKVGAALHDHRLELEHLPGRIAAAQRQLDELEARQKQAVESLEGMRKERREVEKSLQDHEARVVKFKNDLMEVKTNKEYTAVLKEIEATEKEIGEKEERVLELMDSIEESEQKHDDVIRSISQQRGEAEAEKKTLEERVAALSAEAEKLAQQKPKLLLEVSDAVRRQYERLVPKHGETAVTRVEGETCGGCHTQLPPQLVVEVRQNDKMITCQGCGRILVFYAD